MVTEFNGSKLLNGEGLNGTGDRDIQVGVRNNQFEDRIQYNAGMINSTLASLFGGETATQEQVDAQWALRQKLAHIDAQTKANDRERVELRKAAQAEYVESLQNSPKICHLNLVFKVKNCLN